MVRILCALLGGLILGVGVAAVTLRDKPARQNTNVIRDIADVPRMSDTAALKHRQEHFAEITTIEQVFALPTDFARSEALHALAGRADSEGVQRLIFAADRIADELDRYGSLSILFYRLAEIDPASALALVRTAPFRHNRGLRETIWQTWGRSDLEGALAAAKTQTSRADSNLAAQGIYSAYDYMANATTDHIEATLGIGPDRATRSRFLHRLISNSPAEAVAFINGMRRGARRDEYIWWLAYEMTRREGAAAQNYAGLFVLEADAENYRTGVKSRAAAEDPRLTIEAILASGNSQSPENQSGFHMAIRALASTDLDAALLYYSEARSRADKRTIGSIIATEFAARNPAEALAWARASDDKDAGQLEIAVLSKIAETDPQFAIAEAQSLAGANASSRVVAHIMSEIARRNPVEATSYLDLIENPQRRNEVEMQLAANWLQRDSDKALAWILSHDDAKVSQLLQQSSWALLQSDIDAAINVLPRLSDSEQRRWRHEIVQHLAANRSSAEAQGFLRRFEGKPGYDQLKSSYITALARTDSAAALQMADQMSNQAMRDAAYASIVRQVAQRDAREATTMLGSISDAQQLARATANIATAWHNNDAEAAQRWVKSLPRGEARDKAIMQLAGHWHEPTREQIALIDGIQGEQTRSHARLQMVYSVMRTDPEAARQMLKDADIPEALRAQVEATIQEVVARFE